MNVERLRAQPDLVSPKHIAQLKEEFKYAPGQDQVYQRLPSNITVIECLSVLLFQRVLLNTGRGEHKITSPTTLFYIYLKLKELSRKTKKQSLRVKKNCISCKML